MKYKAFLSGSVVVVAFVSGAALADIVNGVEGVEGAGVMAPAVFSGEAVLPPPAGATVIDFDDVSAPCLFSETTALRDAYSGLGVEFEGPDSDDGGAIMDECGNFGVTGQSSPNFLAFNTSAAMSGGGIPRGPETLRFDPVVSLVQANVGSPNVGTIVAEAFDGAGALLDSETLSGTTDLQTILLEGAGIASVVLTFQGQTLVVDDLAFQALDVCDLGFRQFVVGCVRGSVDYCDLDGSGRFDFRDAVTYLRLCR
ncbi:hypothetical protein [Thiococcus pfennigii]|uniref:hypothetical protein n=1 Tax=Thiococcus pfennigii TaxID=1057 RepID=UPI001908D100|nr:hypothetical protein [Thiococcus pfennigii]MBK1731087.1 hypothetical protein [Thiococcus pfennigii]